MSLNRSTVRRFLGSAAIAAGIGIAAYCSTGGTPSLAAPPVDNLPSTAVPQVVAANVPPPKTGEKKFRVVVSKAHYRGMLRYSNGLEAGLSKSKKSFNVKAAKNPKGVNPSKTQVYNMAAGLSWNGVHLYNMTKADQKAIHKIKAGLPKRLSNHKNSVVAAGWGSNCTGENKYKLYYKTDSMGVKRGDYEKFWLDSCNTRVLQGVLTVAGIAVAAVAATLGPVASVIVLLLTAAVVEWINVAKDNSKYNAITIRDGNWGANGANMILPVVIGYQ